MTAFRRLVHARRDNPLARPRRKDLGASFSEAATCWASSRNYWAQGWEHRRDERVAARARGRRDHVGPGVARRARRRRARGVRAHAQRQRVDHRRDRGAVRRGRGAPREAARERVVRHERPQGSDVVVGARARRGDDAARDRSSGGARCASRRAARAKTAWIEARDIAAEVRAKTEVVRRLPIDFAFPNEPGWALEDMRALLVSADFAKLTYLIAPLFASLADEDAMIEFLRKCNGRQAQATLAYACDVVAALPPEARDSRARRDGAGDGRRQAVGRARDAEARVRDDGDPHRADGATCSRAGCGTRGSGATSSRSSTRARSSLASPSPTQRAPRASPPMAFGASSKGTRARRSPTKARSTTRRRSCAIRRGRSAAFARRSTSRRCRTTRRSRGRPASASGSRRRPP